MTGLIRFSLALRLAALLSLPLAILTCVVMQRSPAMIVLIAAAMTFVRPIVLKAVKSTPLAWPSYNSLAAKFLGLALLGGILFVAFSGIGALFTEIDLENRLGPTDGIILLLWTAFAAICLAIPVKLLDGMAAEASHAMRLGPFGFDDGTGRPVDEGGEIIEGEVIHPGEDEDRTR